tara:strand:+ start:45 stop:689 length:645 start_codon:yes stop_codon:yes gene_type:complete
MMRIKPEVLALRKQDLESSRPEVSPFEAVTHCINRMEEWIDIYDKFDTEICPRLTYEELLGAFLLSRDVIEVHMECSDHPSQEFYNSIRPSMKRVIGISKYVSAQMVDIDASRSGSEVIIAGWVTKVRSLVTRQNKPFAIITMEDFTGSIDLTVWPELYEENRNVITEDMALLVKAKIRSRDGRLNVVADRIFVCPAELSVEDREQIERWSCNP